MLTKSLVNPVVFGCILASSLVAQDVISARSGLIHYIQGEVFLADKEVRQKLGEYPEIKIGERLRTGEGLAEVLLTPGVFLRMAENSEVAMVKNALTDTKLDVIAGSVLVEASEIVDENAIALTVKGRTLEVRKRGVFRIDAGTPGRVRAYDGEITIADGAGQTVLKEGRQILLADAAAAEKFSKNDSDSFYRWAGRRSGYISAANVASARAMGMNGSYWGSSNWYYNPLFGMFTFIPMNGRYMNVWNHGYYSPGVAYRPPTDFGNGGWNNGGGGSGPAYSGGGGRGYSGGGGFSGGGGGSAPSGGGGAAPAASSSGSGGGRSR